MNALKPALFAIAATFAATAAFAAQAADLPAEQVQGPVHFLTGGIGKQEADAMKQAMKHYPLSLEFVARARSRDEYLASIPVTIKNGRGQVVLHTVAQGPFLLVKDLHPGKYEISAAQNGRTEKRTAQVPAKGAERLVFEWRAG